MRYYHHPFSREEVVDWIERWIASYRDNGFGLWALVLKQTGEFVGGTGLTWQEVDGEPLFEVGWHVHRRFQRRGLPPRPAGPRSTTGSARWGSTASSH